MNASLRKRLSVWLSVSILVAGVLAVAPFCAQITFLIRPLFLSAPANGMLVNNIARRGDAPRDRSGAPT